MIYGLGITRLDARPRSCVGEVFRTASGNVVLRVGKENPEGWHQTEHVVMTREEAIELALTLIRTA
jgi:hypothetical protein